MGVLKSVAWIVSFEQSDGEKSEAQAQTQVYGKAPKIVGLARPKTRVSERVGYGVGPIVQFLDDDDELLVTGHTEKVKLADGKGSPSCVACRMRCLARRAEGWVVVDQGLKVRPHLRELHMCLYSVKV